MIRIRERLATLSAVVLATGVVTAGIGAGDPSAVFVSSAAMLVVTSVVIAAVVARSAAILVPAARAASRARGRQLRQAALAEPAPAHPDTAGRPRSRAPSRSPAAA